MIDTVKGIPRPDDISQAMKTDPFESLLGICRVLGFHYEIEPFTYRGRTTWTAKLTVWRWPADFYGGAGTQSGKRGFTTVGCETPLDALQHSFYSLVGSLWNSVAMWREIVKETKGYSNWFNAEHYRDERKPPALRADVRLCLECRGSEFRMRWEDGGTVCICVTCEAVYQILPEGTWTLKREADQ